jgi:hypothetical protein
MLCALFVVRVRVGKRDSHIVLVTVRSSPTLIIPSQVGCVCPPWPGHGTHFPEVSSWSSPLFYIFQSWSHSNAAMNVLRNMKQQIFVP